MSKWSDDGNSHNRHIITSGINTNVYQWRLCSKYFSDIILSGMLLNNYSIS